jgi:hypothetical protein
MKTPEDEAFEDIERKQGMWGGGFNAKRKAAMDKINSDFYREYIKYRTAFPKGYTSPAQDGKCKLCVDGCAACDARAQPAQEPVAWITPDGEGFRIRFSAPTNDVPLGWDALYTTPPKRPWVGLTDEEIADYLGDEYHAMTTSELRFFKLGEAATKEKNT